MKITLEVNEPKFVKGDVVEYKNKKNSNSIFVRIDGINYQGHWNYNGGNSYAISETFTYITTVQVNSYYDNIESDPFRPGSCLPFKGEELEQYEKVYWNNQIIFPDTLNNIDLRKTMWEEKLKKIKRK